MHVVQTVAKNTFALFIMNFIILVLGLVFNVTVAREFGSSAFGKFSFALAFTSIFAIIIDFGIGQLAIRDISRDQKQTKRYLGNVLFIKIILSIIYFGLIVCVINAIQYPMDTKLLVYIFGIYAIFSSLKGTFISIFNAFEKMEYNLIVTVIDKAVIVLFGLFLIYSGYDIIHVSSVYIIATILSLVLSFVITTKKIVVTEFKVDLHFCKYLIKTAIPFGIFAIFLTLNNRVDSVMLSIIKGDSDVGLYNAAYTLITALYIIPSSFISALFPLFSRLSSNSTISLTKVYEKACKFLMILAIPIVIGTIILADKIIILLYGETYASSIVPLQILVISIIPVFMHNVLGTLILALNKEKNAVPMWAICATINIVLNLIFIPKYGPIGASFTTLVSETLLCIEFYYFVSKYISCLSVKQMLYKPFIASSMMGIFVFYFKESNLILVIILSSLIYFILIICLNIFSQEDYELFKKMFSKIHINKN